jgi:muconolactone D-isomerase
MREFLVEITTTVPEGTDPAEVDRRRAAEAVRARELTATGNLARLWRPVGELRSIGVWRAADEEELHEKVLGTLPLRPWMSLTVTALEPHPNDPGRHDARTA